MNKNSISVILVLGGFGIYILMRLLFVEPNLKRDLARDYTIKEGSIVSIGRFEVGVNTSTKFSYLVNGIKYEKRLMYKMPCKNFDASSKIDRDKIFNVIFPVAVSNQNPKNAIALLRPKDFDVLNMSFPDSLNSFYSEYLDCTSFEKIHY